MEGFKRGTGQGQAQKTHQKLVSISYCEKRPKTARENLSMIIIRGESFFGGSKRREEKRRDMGMKMGIRDLRGHKNLKELLVGILTDE